MKKEHTHTPWFLELEGNELDTARRWTISAGPNHSLGALRIATVPDRDKEDKANAVLMWAAPELLKALEWCESVYGDDWPENASIRQTIKAAKGGAA